MRAATGLILAAMRLALGGLALLLLLLAAAAAPQTSAGTGARALPADGQSGGTTEPSAATRSPQFSVRLGVPLDEAQDPRAHRYIVDCLPAGSVANHTIMIVNDEPRTAHFTVYPAAAQITGGAFIGAAGRAGNELTGWISTRSLTLAAGQSAVDLITIRVPPNATRGEHYAVIWVEQAVTARSAGQGAIRAVNRVGIPVYLAVSRSGALPTSFIITTLTGQRPTAGQPSLAARVRNTGERAVDLTGQLRLTNGPGGSSADPFPAGQALTLAPGQSGTVTFALPAALSDGPWLATVTLASGLTTATARGNVVFGGHVAAASGVGPLALAWGGGMLLGLSVIAAVTVAHFRRPRRSPA